jgi:hypothetical protein
VGKASGNIAEDITAYGKSLGQIGHRMLTDGKDLVVIDENSSFRTDWRCVPG